MTNIYNVPDKRRKRYHRNNLQLFNIKNTTQKYTMKKTQIKVSHLTDRGSRYSSVTDVQCLNCIVGATNSVTSAAVANQKHDSV